MKLSLSYLGFDAEQMPAAGRYQNDAVESVLFHRDHLSDEYWASNWANIEIAISEYGAENVTFHFPMNASDYIEDSFVMRRLDESYQRASDLGLTGVIVHSNRIRRAAEWRKFDQKIERLRVVEALQNIIESNNTSNTWIGLENMPNVGNSGDETDPLFVSTDDLDILPDSIGIVWDVCHALCSYQYMQAYENKVISDDIYLRPDASQFTNISDIGNRVVHWHFASSTGLNIPNKGTVCSEGMLPAEGDLEERFYTEQMKLIADIGGIAAVNFEVSEEDYSNRYRGPLIMDWAIQTLRT